MQMDSAAQLHAHTAMLKHALLSLAVHNLQHSPKPNAHFQYI